MKKIAFAIEKLVDRSGIVKVVKNIASELSAYAYEIVVVTTGTIGENADEFLRKNKIRIIDLNIERYGHRGKYFYYADAVYAKLSNEHFDVIVVSGTEHVLFYSIGTSRMKSGVPKLLVWEHLNFNAGPKFRLEWAGKRYALKHWDGVVCITKKDVAQYVKYAGTRDRIHQIYNLTDFNAVRKPYDIKSNKIISCGYLAHIKGFDMLVTVAKQVFAKHSDWTWDIYGEGTERENLQELIEDNHLQNQVFLKGYESKINELYAQYSLFVLTSRVEGMGMVLIEAQKSGLPVVSFDIKCGPSDVITDGINGYLIEPFNIEEMAEKIDILIEHPEMRKIFSDNAEINLEEFGKDYIVRKWINILQ